MPFRNADAMSGKYEMQSKLVSSSQLERRLYKEGNNRPPSNNRKPLVNKHNKARNKCHN